MMDEEDDPIDDEQLDDYREMVEQLGTFPDKVTINSLSMMAEDHADSYANAGAIYNVIRERLVTISSEYKLPLVYLLDSILKNVKGQYRPVMEIDVKNWMPIVYQALPEDQRVKLKKVWNIWRDAGVFEESKWREMGQCFSDSNIIDLSSDSAIHPTLQQAGITLGKDGGLLLMPGLRDAMQSILDDLQSDVQDELEKVSLERLAAIDPDLLVKIKQTAEASVGNGSSSGTTKEANAPAKEIDVLAFLIENRTAETIERSNAWQKMNLDYLKDTNEIVHSLQHMVLDGSSTTKLYTQSEAIEMTSSLAAAAVTAGLLTNSLQQIQNEEKKTKSSTSLSGSDLTGSRAVPASSFVAVDKSLFTNDGLKKKNDAVIAFLYEVGLPFISSSDGRRFSTQLELSNHLDALFRRRQLENSMATTEERGWYISDSVWSGESKEEEGGGTSEEANTANDHVAAAEQEADPNSFTMPADESRDRCVICGINFKMFFDTDDYKYSNCREIEVLNDEAAVKESEDMLVHVTCWRNLGCPSQLTPDEALQEAMHS